MGAHSLSLGLELLHARLHHHVVSGGRVFVRVESHAGHSEEVSDGDHGLGTGEGVEEPLVVVLALVVGVAALSPGVVVLLLLPVILELIGHGGQSDTLRKIWEGVDELSLLLLIVVEGAGVTELALSVGDHVLAGLGLVV